MILCNSKGLIRDKVICPICNKSGAKNTMSRWHFENCKFIVKNGDMDEWLKSTVC